MTPIRCANGTDVPAQYVERMAQLCHEVNRHLCGMLEEEMPTWEEAAQWQKDSAMAGVINFLEVPTMTPERSHEGWMEVKRAEGWVYGLKKCEQTKEHPCMKPYSQLGVEQRVKDYLFLANCHLMYEKWLLDIHPQIEARLA